MARNSAELRLRRVTDKIKINKYSSTCREANFLRMLAKTGLLILSNPKHINKLLEDIQKTVKNTLYIQLQSALNEPLGLGNFHVNILNLPPKCSQTIHSLYSHTISYSNNLDVRILLSGLKSNISQIKTQNPIDVVIFDKKYAKESIDNFIINKISNVSIEHTTLTLDCNEIEDFIPEIDNRDSKVYKHVCLGGTFDRLHVAHKLLLSEAILRASQIVTVGITDESMTHNKLLWELIEDLSIRMKNVTDFVTDVCPELNYNICKIDDPFGPAIVDSTMEMIVVSEETIRGGEKINEIRKGKNLNSLEIVPIPFIVEPNPGNREESKISSSNLRLRLLGSLLKPVESKNISINKPYIIGLTGGIASGKSGVINHLKDLGIPIIDCDKLGHKMYEKTGPCYAKVIATFGSKIVKSDDGEIDRKILGNLVFKNPPELKKLTDILWPAMGEEIKNIIQNIKENVVCLEAAVLCQAGWDKNCQEIWVTFVPQAEAVERLKKRNNLTEEEAKDRLLSQPNNQEYISKANVVICPLWEIEHTKAQVHKAWDLLLKRLFNAQ